MEHLVFPVSRNLRVGRIAVPGHADDLAAEVLRVEREGLFARAAVVDVWVESHTMNYTWTMRPILLSMLLASVASAQTLTAPERAIASAVDANNRQALALLERVVDINSGTNNVA